jgi:hypothetical protein
VANERIEVAGITFAQQGLRSFDVSQWVPETSDSKEPSVELAPEVFPNPFHDVLRLKWPNGAAPEWVRVCNALGQVVFESRGAVTQIATANWPTGQYIVETPASVRAVVHR